MGVPGGMEWAGGAGREKWRDHGFGGNLNGAETAGQRRTGAESEGGPGAVSGAGIRDGPGKKLNGTETAGGQGPKIGVSRSTARVQGIFGKNSLLRSLDKTLSELNGKESIFLFSMREIEKCT